VGSGALDVGITGRDLLLDSHSSAHEIAELGFADSTFRFAGPGKTFESLQDLQGKRVATSYPGLVEKFLAAAGVTADLIMLDGAVESAVRLGVADAVADVVSTGSTLRQAGLEIFGPVILESTAVLISRNPDIEGISTLLRRLQGVLVAKQYVLMDYDVPQRLLEQACLLAPGIESPTVSPLHDPDWVAVRVMVPRADRNDVMDKLYDLGARAILVSAIHAARL
jgi:ATP phosphoribosyltransferase